MNYSFKNLLRRIWDYEKSQKSIGSRSCICYDDVNSSFAGYPDVDATADYADSVALLSALEILEGDEQGKFNPESTITRAEFAAVVCRALGLENNANSAAGATIFNDVAANHWATGYINLATQQGIVNGKGNGIFDPEGNVTYAEAVKMLVVALGFEPVAAAKGGYPTGYLAVANSIKMTAGIYGTGTNVPALRKTVAMLTANAIQGLKEVYQKESLIQI